MKNSSHLRKVHHLHKKHNLHHRTVFYMRKGRHIHFHRRIISESLRVLIIASVVSTIGGIGLQALEEKLLVFIPMLILVPALNHMTGSFGTIISSKFTTDLYLGKVGRNWWKSRDIQNLFRSVMIVSFLTALYVSILASAFSMYQGFPLTIELFFKMVLLSITANLCLVSLIFVVSAVAGLYIYSEKKDPNNFLIPLTTSLADLGSMIIFSLMIAFLI